MGVQEVREAVGHAEQASAAWAARGEYERHAVLMKLFK